MNISFFDLLAADFFQYAVLAGVSLALIAGPLGSFVVWRRMSYFGDTLAHSALLGIAIGLISGANPQLSIIISCLLLGLLLTVLERRPSLSSDTLLGILAHSSLALGVLVLSLTRSQRVNLESYLFGELLTVAAGDLIWILLVVLIVVLLLWRFWNQLLSLTVHAELAEIEGVAVQRLKLMLVIMLAMTVAVSMKIVGVLLITSLLIIPAAAARSLARTPEQMAVYASLLGVFSVCCGVIGAFYLDTPVGPSIVVVAALLFFLLNFTPLGRRGI
ncbi:MAG: zinc ABC transporter permease subunit ZnuB [Pseudomonadales bacterium]|nr:zinc ABC transporter permease subunit ZnuB [Pseudomonadales bacterium]